MSEYDTHAMITQMEIPMEDINIQLPGVNSQNSYTANDGTFSNSLICNQDKTYDPINNYQQTTLIPSSTLPDSTL